ncbi:MAG TPA: two-component regulator propeller domain-containing protein, partial [Rhodothermia bacterium]
VAFVARAAAILALGIINYHLAISNSWAQQLGQEEIPQPLAARTVSPRFEHLKLEDGLSQGTIHDIFQDSRGFMWFTTQDGLNRYDGHEVKAFTHEPFDETSLGAGFTMGMDEAADGALWVGNASGLYRLDPLTEKFTSYRHDPEDSTSLSNNFVWAVTIDSEGRLWAGTNNGLNLMNPETPGVFDRFYSVWEDETTLSDSRVFTIFEDSYGEMWLGTRNGISITSRTATGRFERLLASDRKNRAGGFGFFDNEAYGFLERPEEPGILWVGTSTALVRIKVDTRETERFVMDPSYKGGNPIQNATWRLAQDPVNPSILWVPTFGAGLGRFDVRAKRFVVFRSDKDNPNGPLDDAHVSVFADRSGVIWVGSQNQGVSRFNPASVTFAHYRASDRRDGAYLSGNIIWGVFEARDGILWVGTTDESRRDVLTALDRANGTARHYRHVPGDPSSRDPGNANPIFEDSRGNLWIGNDTGIDLLDRSRNKFIHFRADPESPGAMPGVVSVITEDRSGNLWFGHTLGLAKMRPDAFGKFEAYLSDPEDSTTVSPFGVTAIMEDLAGFIWAGANSGLSRVDPETGKATRYEHDPNDPTSLSARDVNALLERRRESGIIWLGTGGGGVNRLDVRTGEFRRFTERDGLANNVVYGILEDDLGRLWISTNHGLSRFDPETETFKNYGVEIGLQGLEFDQGAYHKSRSGELFFGGTNGLNAFYPNELSENLNAPEVQLVDLKLFNKSVMETGAVALNKPVSEVKEIRLDYSQKDVTFDFVAFHYANPSGNQYAYKLEGFNDDWVYVGDQRTASFTNLEPGEYTFRVKAANSDGIWNEEGASIRVIVEPPFWATWWFRSLALLG